MSEYSAPDQAPQELVYPFYLDVEMLTGFLATLEGGFSLTSDVSTSEQSHDSSDKSGTADAGTIGLIGSLFKVNMQGNLERTSSLEDRREDKFVLQHTETSLFNRLRSLLIQRNMVTSVHSETTELPSLGAIVEIDGVVQDNPLSQVLSVMELFTNLSQPPPTPQGNQGRRRNRGGGGNQAGSVSSGSGDTSGQEIIDLLLAERSTRHLSDVLITVQSPGLKSGILTLRRSATNEESMEHFVGSRCLVLGKVSGTILSGETVPLYRRSILNMMQPQDVEQVFSDITSNDAVRLDIPALTVAGPAIQVLPLAIYV